MPTTMGRPVKDIISRLLMHNPAARLGCDHKGSSEVLSHDFFAAIQWKQLEERKLPSLPFVPQINVRATSVLALATPSPPPRPPLARPSPWRLELSCPADAASG